MKERQTRFDGTTDSDTTRRDESGEQTDESATEVGNRRQFLLSVGAATAFLAGCVGGDDGDDGDDSTSSNNGGDDSSTGNGDDGGTGNGGDGTGNGDDGGTGNGGDGGTGNGGDSGTGNGDDGGTGNGDDSSTGNGGDDGSTGNGGDGGTGNGGDGGTGNGGDGTASEEFFNTVNWSQEFRMVFNNKERGTTVEYRFSGGEQYIDIDGDEEGDIEYYMLEDAVYLVNQNQCIVYDSFPGGAPNDPTEFESIEQLEEQQPDITSVGTDTIDGDPVTVYEVDAETTYTMYVLESGFPRRAETPQGTVDYYDWGDTEPIEPPDMNCTSPGGGGGGGDGGYGDDGGSYP
jgi:hypothetical protein